MAANQPTLNALRFVWATLFACVLVGPQGAALSRQAPPAPFTGQFEIRHALTFYVVNEAGVDFTVDLSWQQPLQSNGDWPRLIRIFDPSERLVLRRFEPCQRVAGEPPQYHVEVPVQATGAGVYQIIVTGFGGSLDFAVRAADGAHANLLWGVMGFPRLSGRGNQFENAHVCLPAGLDQLSIRCEGAVDRLQLIDDSGRPRMDIRGMNAGGTSALPNVVGAVWKLSVNARAGAEPYRIDFGGAPIILCPDQNTARTIGASMDVLPDGTICFHKFQTRVKQVLERYRRMAASAFVVHPPALERYRTQWLRDAARNDLLLGGGGVYSTFPLVLNEQNLDPTSPWFGTIKVWHDGPNQRAKPQNPWARCDRMGLTRVSELAAVLACVYSINEPFNPLYRNEALRNRIIIASLQELMLLGEHEMPLRVIPDGFFGGERAFLFSSFLRSFPLVINDCPPDVREVWTEGLRRYVDHESISQVASTCNQWSFTIKALQHFYDGTGEQEYRDAVERHVDWMLTRNQWDLGHMPAGYFFDAGPDAMYNGITTHNLGWIYKQLTKHGQSPVSERLREALRSCIDMFNHTIAPQPDGTILGATNFCTRTPGNWTQAQYGGGFTMLADEVAEASPLLGRIWPTVQSRSKQLAAQRAVEQAVNARISYWPEPDALWQPQSAGGITGGPELHFMIWEHFAKQPLDGKLPMATSSEFVRNFGDEFLCVRLPRYYAFIHAGKPLPESLKPHRPIEPDKQHAHNGGGLSMFWSPNFGCSILAQNWSAYASHAILIEQKSAGGSRIDWEDYWTVEHSFEKETAKARVTGAIRDQPLKFERQYRFLEIGVECKLTLMSAAQVQYVSAWESFPYPSRMDAKLQVSVVNEQGQPVQNRPGSAIVFRNASDEAHVIVFAKPRLCELGNQRVVDAYGAAREFNRVLAAIPKDLTDGQPQTLRWCLMVVPAGDVPRTIRAAIAAMAK